jgi:hypothetical protein
MARVTTHISMIAALLVCGGVGLDARAQEATLLNDQSGGEVEITGQDELLLTGLQGTFSLRLGKPGMLRYLARDVKSRRQDVPVALWIEGTRLILEPLDAETAERVFMEITVPPEVAATVEVSDSVVNVGGLMSELSVDGKGVDLHAAGVVERASIRLEGGSALLEGMRSDVELVGSDLTGRLKQIGGQTELDLERVEMKIDQLSSSLDMELEESKVTVVSVLGRVRGVADGGALSLSRVTRGADLEVSGTPIQLTDIEGETIIETDTMVEFREMKSDMTVSGYGAGLRGLGNVGSVSVTTDGAEVTLENIQGPVKVAGQDLRVRLLGLGNTTEVRTAFSEIWVENASGALDIENDLGSVSVTNVSGPVKVLGGDAAVHVRQARSPLAVATGSGEVEVSWTETPAEGDSTLTSESGNIRVGLPPSARCRIEAEARYGQVVSNLDSVRVSDDGRFASGQMGGADKPVIQIRSGGEVHIVAATPPRTGAQP